jgi:hypothetical protein
MQDKSRRQFFKTGFLEQIAKITAGFREGMAVAERKECFERFFESDESCYALALAYPDDLVMETARLHGIETKGREKKDIVRELFLKKGGNEYRF